MKVPSKKKEERRIRDEGEISKSVTDQSGNASQDGQKKKQIRNGSNMNSGERHGRIRKREIFWVRKTMEKTLIINT
jgi:hypothetical protein